MCYICTVCREQEELKQRLVVEDGEEVWSWEEDTRPFTHLTTVAEVDISFDKDHPNHACAMLSVLSYPQLKVYLYLCVYVYALVLKNCTCIYNVIRNSV